MSLSARTVLVTGASRGVGLEFVKQILKLPSPPDVLIAACRDPASARNLVDIAKANPTVKVVRLDVQKDEDIESAFDATKAAVGDWGLNLLINNAGINDKADGGGLTKQTREMMQRHFDVNVSGPVMIAQKFLPLLQQAASQSKSNELSCSRAGIINISSIMGSCEITSHEGYGTSFHYKCSKTAINMATILLSRELKDTGIFVAALHPGWVRTDMGTDKAPVSPEESIEGLLQVIGTSGDVYNGKLIDFKGEILPF